MILMLSADADNEFVSESRFGMNSSQLLPWASIYKTGVQLDSVTIVRSEVFTAVTMKNAVFWYTETQFVSHRKHILSLLQTQPVNAM
jgi:hypothetical protein